MFPAALHSTEIVGIGRILQAGLYSSKADGDWVSFWANDYSSLDATCFRFAQAEQIDITCECGYPPLDRFSGWTPIS